MERKDAKVEKEEAEKYRGLQAEIVSAHPSSITVWLALGVCVLG